VVTICTASLTFHNSTFCPHTVFMCFVWIWEQRAIISLYNINWLVCIIQTESVYCAVQAKPLYKRHVSSLPALQLGSGGCSRETGSYKCFYNEMFSTCSAHEMFSTCSAHEMFSTCSAHEMFSTCSAHEMFSTCSAHETAEQDVLTLRWLMSYIYGAPILDVSRSHTTTQHSR